MPFSFCSVSTRRWSASSSPHSRSSTPAMKVYLCTSSPWVPLSVDTEHVLFAYTTFPSLATSVIAFSIRGLFSMFCVPVITMISLWFAGEKILPSTSSSLLPPEAVEAHLFSDFKTTYLFRNGTNPGVSLGRRSVFNQEIL
ncbi:hypothetical protein GEV33_006221 [Tenebrio molitor]|uniref:Uncharacterized protein n=1 Tax=Tenebrio molitor TaxID=7067 RepID=A0A8J6HK96_TENMO|nr:hypothetical protein GEV33_006221 [Tenebrio molitor]